MWRSLVCGQLHDNSSVVNHAIPSCCRHQDDFSDNYMAANQQAVWFYKRFLFNGLCVLSHCYPGIDMTFPMKMIKYFFLS